jgi:hypothetical protein
VPARPRRGQIGPPGGRGLGSLPGKNRRERRSQKISLIPVFAVWYPSLASSTGDEGILPLPTGKHARAARGNNPGDTKYNSLFFTWFLAFPQLWITVLATPWQKRA